MTVFGKGKVVQPKERDAGQGQISVAVEKLGRIPQRIEVLFQKLLLAVLNVNVYIYTFKYRLGPIKVWSIGKVLSVEIQTLSELHEFTQFHYQLTPSKSGFSGFGQCRR